MSRAEGLGEELLELSSPVLGPARGLTLESPPDARGKGQKGQPEVQAHV